MKLEIDNADVWDTSEDTKDENSKYWKRVPFNKSRPTPSVWGLQLEGQNLNLN